MAGSALAGLTQRLKESLRDLPYTIFPVLKWVPAYKWRDNLVADVGAGLTVGTQSVPQSMAYALICGVQPVYGLYTGIFAGLLYFFLGSSPQLIIGPEAVLALVAASAVQEFPENSSERMLHLSLITLMSGVVQLVLSLFRAGMITNLLAHPVIAGFTSASGVIIFVGQIKYFLGISYGPTSEAYQDVYEVCTHIGNTNVYTLLTGIGCAIVLGIFRLGKLRNLPGPFLVLVVATMISWLADFPSRHIATVTVVPQGFPTPSLPTNASGYIATYIPRSLLVAMMSFVTSLSISRTFAIRNKYEVDANQDLFALGCSNIFASFFQTFPATGSFSRTAVNAALNAKSGLANLLSALVVLISILFLTRAFYYLPLATLAATVMAAAVSLVDVKEIVTLFRTDKVEFFVFFSTFVATLVLGVEYGILFGLGISILVLVLRIAYGATQILMEPETRNEESGVGDQHDGATFSLTMPGLLCFASVGFFRDRLKARLREYVKKHDGRRRIQVVCDFTHTVFVDVSAVHVLNEMKTELERDTTLGTVSVAFASANADILRLFSRLSASHPKTTEAANRQSEERVTISESSPLLNA